MIVEMQVIRLDSLRFDLYQSGIRECKSARQINNLHTRQFRDSFTQDSLRMACYEVMNPFS
jgi:hypothetical protein